MFSSRKNEQNEIIDKNCACLAFTSFKNKNI